MVREVMAMADEVEHLSSEQLRDALEWCLRHGVKAVDWCGTGYWCQSGIDGSEIMPPAKVHTALDEARRVVLGKFAAQSKTGE